MAQRNVRIGMNGSMLDEEPTGIGVYSYNVINSLSRLYREENDQPLTVFTPTDHFLSKDLRLVRLPRILQSSRYGKLAAISRFCWNSFYYPLLGRGYSVLLSPTTHGSLTLKNQVITIHDLLSLRFGNINGPQRFYYKYLLPRLVSRSRSVVAPSETTRQDIIRLLNCPADKVHVIQNGYDREKYRPADGVTDLILQSFGLARYILAVGPTYAHKNFELLIDAYAALPKSIRDVYPLVIAGGKKPYFTQICEYAAKTGLSDKIHFLGYVAAELMAPLYQEASVLVFPSLYEGFGFPLLEAMACGCPVIASNTSSMPEVCGDAALYFDPMDQNALTQAITDVLTRDDLVRRLRENGLQRAKLFSWEKTAASLKALLDSFVTFQN